MKFKVQTVTAPPRIDHDLLADIHHVFALNFPSGEIILPCSVGFSRVLAFKKVAADEGAIKISASAGQSVDGLASFSLATQFQAVTLISGENGWHILSALGGN